MCPKRLFIDLLINSFNSNAADGAYVAIVEHTRHAFLYEKPEGFMPVAKQRIVDLGPEASPIMGAVATNKHLILLTTNKLYELEIYP